MPRLSKKWAEYLVSQPEAGMGYWRATVFLSDGRKVEKALIDSGWIIKVGDGSNIPFVEADIDRIVVT